MGPVAGSHQIILFKGWLLLGQDWPLFRSELFTIFPPVFSLLALSLHQGELTEEHWQRARELDRQTRKSS